MKAGSYFAEDPGHYDKARKDQDNKGTDGLADKYEGFECLRK